MLAELMLFFIAIVLINHILTLQMAVFEVCLLGSGVSRSNLQNNYNSDHSELQNKVGRAGCNKLMRSVKSYKALCGRKKVCGEGSMWWVLQYQHSKNSKR